MTMKKLLMIIIGTFSLSMMMSSCSTTHQAPPPQAQVQPSLTKSLDGWDSQIRFDQMDEDTNGISQDIVVPQTPTTYHQQTNFLFDGVTPSDESFILQPVLSYGRAVNNLKDAHHWYTSLFYYTNANNVKSYNLRRVNVGDKLRMSVKFHHTTGEEGDISWYYRLSITNMTQKWTTSQTVSVPKEANVVFASVMETYGVQSCHDLPTTHNGLIWTNTQLYSFNRKVALPKITFRNVINSECGLSYPTLNPQTHTGHTIFNNG